MAAEVLATKEVPIVLNTVGTPAAGFRQTGEVESDYSAVMLAGSASDLAGVNSIVVPAELLNISDAQENVSTVVNLREYLPDGVRLADSSFNGRMQVTVYIEPEVQRTFDIAPEDVSVINVPQGFEVQLSDGNEGTHELRIKGLEAEVSVLQENALAATIDIAGWMEEQGMEKLSPGTYSIPVSFTLPENVQVEEPVSLRAVIVELEES